MNASSTGSESGNKPPTSSSTLSTTASASSHASLSMRSPVAIPEFTEEDYLLYLEHPQWTREDTLSLLDAVRIFDFEWNLVASTFNGDSRKTPAACQNRYRQLEEFVAAKKRQNKFEGKKGKRSSNTKSSQPQSKGSVSKRQRSISPSGSTPRPQHIKPREQVAKSSTSPQPSSQTQSSNGMGRSPLPALPSQIGIPAANNTTIFPIGSSPFAFDPSILMRQPQMSSIFALSPLFSTHPSLTNLPSLPLPSLNATALPSLSPAALQAIAMSAMPQTQSAPVANTIVKQPIPVPSTQKHNSPTNSGDNPSSSNTSPSSKSSPIKRPASAPSFSPVALAPSPAAPSNSSASSDGSLSSDDFRKKKRRRRTASEISRNFKCDIASCTKAYGSEGALKMHIRLKHPGLRASMKQPYVRSNSLLLSPWLSMPPVVLGQTPPGFAAVAPTGKLPVPTPIKPNNNAASSQPSSASASPKALLVPKMALPLLPNQISPGLGEAGTKKKEQVEDKLNLPFLRLEIGGYECASKVPGDLIVKFNFRNKRLRWAVRAACVKLTVAIDFDDIAGFGLGTIDGCAVLTIEFKRPPNIECDGTLPFRIDQVARFKRHALHFAQGVLAKPVEMMITADARLRELAKIGLPPLDNPFFEDQAADHQAASTRHSGAA